MMNMDLFLYKEAILIEVGPKLENREPELAPAMIDGRRPASSRVRTTPM